MSLLCQRIRKSAGVACERRGSGKRRGLELRKGQEVKDVAHQAEEYEYYPKGDDGKYLG